MHCYCVIIYATVHACPEASSYIMKSTLKSNEASGPEHATYFINRVKERGGLATYYVFGTDFAAGHHHNSTLMKRR